MALSLVGTTNTAIRTTFSPSWNQLSSFNYTHPNGVDGFVMIVITMSNSSNFSSTGVTYGSQQFTLLNNASFSGQSQRQAVYGLLSPPTGSNVVSITFTSQQFNPVSVLVQSFHGCGGFGNFATDGASSSPNSKTLSVSAGSSIYATSISTQTIDRYEIDSVNEGELFEHNVNRQVSGAFSGILSTAGSKDVTAYSISTAYTLTNSRFEIKESTGPVTSSEGNFLQFF